MNIEKLKKCFKTAMSVKAKYIAVKIKMNNLEKCEIIVNPIENATEKLKYYSEAYNEDLTLKACKDIKIVDFTFGNELSDIEEDLCY